MITRTDCLSAPRAGWFLALVASVASVPFVPWFAGCSSDPSDQSDASDVDSDSDTDTDTDTDTDMDTDSDTDTGDPATEGPVLHAVWVFSETSAFAVGDEGVITHLDGTTWSWMASPVASALDAVWGSSPDNVYAVGAGGAIIRYDGDSWGEVESPTGVALHGLWGNSSTDIWAVGEGCATVHFDGATWQLGDAGCDFALTDVWGSSSGDVWAVGDPGGFPEDERGILHWDGATWSGELPVADEVDLGDIPYARTVWGAGPGDVYAAGPGWWETPFEGCTGTSIAHFDGAHWKSFLYDGCGEGAFATIWGSAADEVHVLSTGFEWARFDGTEWETVDVADDAVVHDLHGSAPTNLIAVGGTSVGLADGVWSPRIWRFDGEAWSVVDLDNR
jgi:hypothetical protein